MHRQCGEDPYPIGELFEASPYLNLLLYPEPVKFKRRNPLDPKRFQYLEGCVRQEAAYDIPTFDSNNDDPLIYLSFGSLGFGDTELLNRIIKELGKLPCRALVYVGDYRDAYQNLPPNIQVKEWFPQPTVISFETDEEAIEIANETRCGLQMAVFTSSLKRCFFCSERLRTGNIVINETTVFWEPHWPFGGGEGAKSGYGRSGGRFTIDDVTHLKSVCIDLAKTL